MAWTSPTTRTTGELITASIWNTDLTNNLLFLYTAAVNKAIIRDEKTTGTEGGSSSAATWNNCSLNTEVSDPGNIVTIVSNKFVPVSGTFLLRAVKSAWDDVTMFIKLRLYNVTAAAVVEEGLNNDGNGGGTGHLNCKFTANGTDEYRFDLYTSTAQVNSGLGRAVNDGSTEVYLEAELSKIG